MPTMNNQSHLPSSPKGNKGAPSSTNKTIQTQTTANTPAKTGYCHKWVACPLSRVGLLSFWFSRATTRKTEAILGVQHITINIDGVVWSWFSQMHFNFAAGAHELGGHSSCCDGKDQQRVEDPRDGHHLGRGVEGQSRSEGSCPEKDVLGWVCSILGRCLCCVCVF